MQIREGAYYRTRSGDVVGPMQKPNDLVKTDYPWVSQYECWTDAGKFNIADEISEADLISEVYVSDTPPANAPAIRDTKTMQIREGAYYRTREGRVIGPMKHVDYRAEKWKFAAVGFNDGAPCWTDEGRWCEFDDYHVMDLISEVYVSDTPPAEAPALETKTLRDEFAMAALQGLMANPDNPPDTRREWAEEAYLYADAMMEARKK